MNKGTSCEARTVGMAIERPRFPEMLMVGGDFATRRRGCARQGKSLTEPLIGVHLPACCQTALEQAIDRSVLAAESPLSE